MLLSGRPVGFRRVDGAMAHSADRARARVGAAAHSAFKPIWSGYTFE